MALCGFQFFRYYALSSQMQRYPIMLLVPLIAILSWKQLFSKQKDIFFRLMRYLLVSWIVSMFMSYVFWGQPMSKSYSITSQYLFIIMFFYLCKEKCTKVTIEKVIVFFGWAYIILWLYSFSRFPEVTFGWYGEEGMSEDMSRGMVRINFTGRLSLILGYFYYLNKSFLNRSPKYKIFAITFFVFLILQLTRQLILWSGIVTVIFIFLRSKKIASFLGIIFAALYIGSANIEFSNDSIIGSMLNITNEEMNGELYSGENPRITEYKYFFTKWSKNAITDVFGNGVPDSSTGYGRYEQRLWYTDHIYLSDTGYPTMYVYVGLIGLILYIVLFIRAVLQKMPKEISYVKMFMLFMIPANFAADWFEKPDGQLCLILCIYLIYICRNKPYLLGLEQGDKTVKGQE